MTENTSSFLATSISSQCRVCLVQPQCSPVTMACLHVFCKDCAVSALKISPLCPLCKNQAEPLKEGAPEETLADIDLKIEELEMKRSTLLVSKQREIHKMALEFLVESKNQKLEKITKLKKELSSVQFEIGRLSGLGSENSSCSSSDDMHKPSKKRKKVEQPEGIQLEDLTDNYANVLKNFGDLENNFFSTSRKYKDIGKVIYDAFKYDSLSVLGSIAINGIGLSQCYIYNLAISGVGVLSAGGSLDTVNLYNYQAVLDNPLPVLYPVSKLKTSASTWSTAWNPCSHNLLGVADIKSDIKVWDVTAGVPTTCFQGHTASKYLNVEFTPTRPQQLVSAGFDAVVKVWRLNERGSVLSIRTPDKLLKLCCKPKSPYHLAVSSLDRVIYNYDLRKADKPVNSLVGHTKSVAQLSFLDSKTLISGSVDGTLKQWNYETGQCERTYHGHSNTSKFIGLDVLSDQYIVSGSENNSLVLYHEALSRPVLSHQFPSSQSIQGNAIGDVNERHVTAISCKDDVVCVGNDMGIIHVVKFNENDRLRDM